MRGRKDAACILFLFMLDLGNRNSQVPIHHSMKYLTFFGLGLTFAASEPDSADPYADELGDLGDMDMESLMAMMQVCVVRVWWREASSYTCPQLRAHPRMKTTPIFLVASASRRDQRLMAKLGW